MSTTTLVSLDATKLHEEGGLSPAPTPSRISLDTARDMEKLPEEEHDVGDDPPPLSNLRMSLLVMGLTLSIFLVALDFVSICSQISLTFEEHHHHCNSSNYRRIQESQFSCMGTINLPVHLS